MHPDDRKLGRNSYPTLFFAGDLDRDLGKDVMTDRNIEFTASEVWKTAATSGSSTTATESRRNRPAKRFGRARE